MNDLFLTRDKQIDFLYVKTKFGTYSIECRTLSLQTNNRISKQTNATIQRQEKKEV